MIFTAHYRIASMACALQDLPTRTDRRSSLFRGGVK